jgi:hypothetical protein
VEPVPLALLITTKQEYYTLLIGINRMLSGADVQIEWQIVMATTLLAWSLQPSSSSHAEAVHQRHDRHGKVTDRAALPARPRSQD